jgi:hypothetical protein
VSWDEQDIIEGKRFLGDTAAVSPFIHRRTTFLK